jgi:hypothetical protein
LLPIYLGNEFPARVFNRWSGTSSQRHRKALKKRTCDGSEGHGKNMVFFCRLCQRVLDLVEQNCGLTRVQVGEALFDDISDHRVDVPVNKLGVFEFSNCMFDHVALGVDEVTNLANYGLVKQDR